MALREVDRVTPLPPKFAPPIIVPFTPIKEASSIRMALSPSSTEEGAVIVAPLVSWSVLPELTKMLCEGYDVFCRDWVVVLLSLK